MHPLNAGNPILPSPKWKDIIRLRINAVVKIMFGSPAIVWGQSQYRIAHADHADHADHR